MRNLLVITQKTDGEDDLLGFFTDWLKEFSKKFDKVFVITLAKGKYDLPANVFIYSLGKEKNSSKFTRVFKFYKFLFRLVPKSRGIFAHMSPIFVIASWPVAFIFRKKIILWYLHRSVTLRLKIAQMLCYRIVTATKESLNIHGKKITELGHGINTDKFKIQRNWSASGRLKILSVGRISKIKNYDILLETAKILKEKDLNFEIKIIGRPVMPPDVGYFQSLKELKTELNLGDSMEFLGFVPHDKIPEYYKTSDLVVGLTPNGGIDKIILEGMASGCLVLTSNNANRKYFGNYGDDLIFNYLDPADLAGKIMSLYELSPENKKEISDFLVESVVKNHNLENLINRISSLL